LRELMLSLANTLWRWYSTVRGLMNSRPPISALESQFRAKRAIWASWAVRAPAGVGAGSDDGPANRPQLACRALGERLEAHRRQHLVRGAEMVARVLSPLPAA
jgi:hypothetical protein